MWNRYTMNKQVGVVGVEQEGLFNEKHENWSKIWRTGECTRDFFAAVCKECPQCKEFSHFVANLRA